MEKYVKLKDVKELLKKLANEPRYQHEDEDFFTGICTVAQELDELPTMTKDGVRAAEWIVTYKGLLCNDYACSSCGTKALEGNSGHYDRLTSFCRHCGAFMIGGKVK